MAAKRPWIWSSDTPRERNHSVRAQNLLMQVIAEWNIGVAVIAEPWIVDRPDWIGDQKFTDPFAGTRRGVRGGKVGRHGDPGDLCPI